jgi:predicted RNase H-like HicB family nuclease
MRRLPAANYREQTRGRTEEDMRSFTAVVEKCPDTGLYVGYVPGFPGAHSQAETLDELQRNLREVIEMLVEDGEPKLEAEFIGTQTVMIA